MRDGLPVQHLMPVCFVTTCYMGSNRTHWLKYWVREQTKDPAKQPSYCRAEMHTAANPPRCGTDLGQCTENYRESLLMKTKPLLKLFVHVGFVAYCRISGYQHSSKQQFRSGGAVGYSLNALSVFSFLSVFQMWLLETDAEKSILNSTHVFPLLLWEHQALGSGPRLRREICVWFWMNIFTAFLHFCSRLCLADGTARANRAGCAFPFFVRTHHVWQTRFRRNWNVW